MAPRSTFPLVDQLLGGTLAAELSRLRGEGVSFDGISRWLMREHDVDVSIETIRRWVRDLDPEAA